jgi:hypothetical protein
MHLTSTYKKITPPEAFRLSNGEQINPFAYRISDAPDNSANGQGVAHLGK